MVTKLFLIHHGALVRARDKAFDELELKIGPFGSSELEAAVALLDGSCMMAISLSNSKIQDGVEYCFDVFDGKDALIITTPHHKIVCFKVGINSELFEPALIFPVS